jgi:O-succinylbenzoate synthase
MTNRFWKIENATSFTQQNVPSHRPRTAVLDSSDCKSLVSKTGFRKGVKRVSVFDEMRVKLKPQPIINGDHNDTHRESI